MSDIKNRVETLTLTVEFPQDVKLTETQKAYICEEVARLTKGLINSMTFEKRSDQIKTEHTNDGGNNEQENQTTKTTSA